MAICALNDLELHVSVRSRREPSVRTESVDGASDVTGAPVPRTVPFVASSAHSHSAPRGLGLTLEWMRILHDLAPKATSSTRPTSSPSTWEPSRPTSILLTSKAPSSEVERTDYSNQGLTLKAHSSASKQTAMTTPTPFYSFGSRSMAHLLLRALRLPRTSKRPGILASMAICALNDLELHVSVRSRREPSVRTESVDGASDVTGAPVPRTVPFVASSAHSHSAHSRPRPDA